MQYRSPERRFRSRGTQVGPAGGWAVGAGGAFVVEELAAPGHTELVFPPGLSEGAFLAIAASHFTLLMCVSTGKVGSEMSQGTGLEI